MMCVDANQDGRVDFNEFTDRFHNPAKDIGFSVAVLLTNLSEHIPNDPRSVFLQHFTNITSTSIEASSHTAIAVRKFVLIIPSLESLHCLLVFYTAE